MDINQIKETLVTLPKGEKFVYNVGRDLPVSLGQFVYKLYEDGRLTLTRCRNEDGDFNYIAIGR